MKHCYNCIFWTAVDGKRLRRGVKQDGIAECRAQSPLPLVGPDGMGKWPKTKGYQWCGQHSGSDKKIDGIFSPRVQRRLIEAGIETVDQLEQTTRRELESIKAFGAGCLKEVEAYFQSRGLQLA